MMRVLREVERELGTGSRVPGSWTSSVAGRAR